MNHAVIADRLKDPMVKALLQTATGLPRPETIQALIALGLLSRRRGQRHPRLTREGAAVVRSLLDREAVALEMREQMLRAASRVDEHTTKNGHGHPPTEDTFSAGIIVPARKRDEVNGARPPQDAGQH